MKSVVFWSALCLSVGGLLFVDGSFANATTITVSTSEAEFQPGVRNQGWWSTWESTPPGQANFDGNDNYFVGSNSTMVHRDFFTFYLPASEFVGQTIMSATFRVTEGGWNQVDVSNSKTIEFFDVSTDAATLNKNDGTNDAIFDDLGTGVSYGLFDVSTVPASALSVLEFALNEAALSDMNHAIGGYFSIGGSRPGAIDRVDDFGFSSTGSIDQPGGLQELVLTTVPASQSVPEPSTFMLVAGGLAGIVASGSQSVRRFTEAALRAVLQ
jgi:hypothetical protein